MAVRSFSNTGGGAATSSQFLSAEWRDLAMLNFEVDPFILKPLVPAGTELDEWGGKTFVSLVAFLFLNTRVLGIAIPFHRNFEEVNLRFYVRRLTQAGWRRGVVFIKELVPRRAIAWTARAFYGENYVAVRMGHSIDEENGSHRSARRVSYWWRFGVSENRLEMSTEGEPAAVERGSHEEFITEHYWGYSRRGERKTVEYNVEHPPWRVWTAEHVQLRCDVAKLYGDRWVEPLRNQPASAFVANGSAVTVFKGRLLSDD